MRWSMPATSHHCLRSLPFHGLMWLTVPVVTWTMILQALAQRRRRGRRKGRGTRTSTSPWFG
eukprot:5962593-Prorocentrum_lima.AAC.1